MTRFDADAPADRRELFADAVAAHRERKSAFCTVEAAEDAGDEEVPPWVQFGDGVLNVDCTDAELDRLKSLLGEFPAFTIDELHRPETAEGTNARVSALADGNRIAECIDRIFQEVYGQPETYRAWVTAL